MALRHDNLFNRIATFEALHAASRRAVRGKRHKPGASRFQFSRERELLRLLRELKDGSYRSGRYLEFEVTDPKVRKVSAAPFRDRVVQHALLAVVAPIFEAGFIGNSFANRLGKGTHKAIAAFEHYRDRNAFVLRCDIFRYFPSIDHAILKELFRRRIRCERTLALMDTIIDGSNAQEPVFLHFPGDDLLTPVERRRGLPIGNLMSQFSANLYLDRLDHFCSEVLRAPYVRYVDDFALFAADAWTLAEHKLRVADHLAGRRLKLHPRKTLIAASAEPAEFLGYVLHADGRRSLPSASIGRFKKRLRRMRDCVGAGAMSVAEANCRIDAWRAHAYHTHARGLNRALLGRRGRPFGSGPVRPLAPTA